jgi:hypothetical protein
MWLSHNDHDVHFCQNAHRFFHLGVHVPLYLHFWGYTLRRKSKDWSARNRNNVSEWSDMSNRGLLFQRDNTTKIRYLYDHLLLIFLIRAENSNTYTTTTTGNEPAKPIRLTNLS